MTDEPVILFAVPAPPLPPVWLAGAFEPDALAPPPPPPVDVPTPEPPLFPWDGEVLGVFPEPPVPLPPKPPPPPEPPLPPADLDAP